MNYQEFTIQTRQRLPEAAHYGEWRDVPGPFPTKDAAKAYGQEIAARSHSLDVRVVMHRAKCTIRNEGALPPVVAA